MEPLEATGAANALTDDDAAVELPEWMTSAHDQCPAPSAVFNLLDPAGRRIEWPCGIRYTLQPPYPHVTDQELHDQALALAESELRVQHGVTRMRASRLGTVHASGGIVSSGGFAAPAAPVYDFGGPAPGAAGAAMPVLKSPRGKIEMEMTVTPEGASWIRQLWEQAGRQRS